MAAVRARTVQDTGPMLVRLVAVHAVVLFVGLAVVGVALGALIGVPILGLAVAIVGSVAGTYWRIRDVDGWVAAATRARALAPGEEPRLDNLVESAAMAAGVARPTLHLIDSTARNAIAWGIGNGAAHLAITRGMLDTSDRIALEATLGRQCALVADRAVDVTTLAARLFGAWARGPLEAPIARIVNGALDARVVARVDIDGAGVTRYPPGLVRALEATRGQDTVIAHAPRSLAALWFVDPGHAGAFDVHPPVEDRIDLVREL